MPFTFGFQAVGFPSAGFSAAAPLRETPPIDENSPPAPTVDPDTANANTMELTFGFQAVAAPLVASTAARLFRVSEPLIELGPLKSPPR